MKGNKRFEVKLLSCTPDAEIQIMRAARVSSSNRNCDKPGLLRFLIREAHWSPFEMANMCVEITGSRAILRQIIRHRSFSFQEFSQRYAKVDQDSFLKNRARRQDHKNRQNSIDDIDDNVQKTWDAIQDKINDIVCESYQWAIENGIAKECARCILPEGNTKSTLCMNGTLRSWIHYLDLRCGNGTQSEHTEIANAIREIFLENFPIISKSLKWAD